MTAGAILLVVALLGLVIYSLRQRSTSHGEVPRTSVTGASPRIDASPTLPRDGNPSSWEREPDCDEELATFAQQLDLGSAWCRANLIARGCAAPLPFPEGHGDVADITRMLGETTGSQCPGLRYEVLCDEFPCLVAFDRDSLDDSCDIADDLIALGDNPGAHLGGTWGDAIVTATVSPPPGSPLLDRFEARLDARKRRLQQHWHEPTPETWSCARLATERKRLAEDPCGVVAESWGCEDLGDVHPWLENHVARAEELVDNLVDTCPNFAQADMQLLCDQTPCVVVVRAPRDTSIESVFCGERFGAVGTKYMAYELQLENHVFLGIPMWDALPDEAPDDVELSWSNEAFSWKMQGIIW